MGRDLCVVLVAAAAVAVPPATARGATDTLVQLDYRGDAQGGCVEADELRHMVTDHLGRDPFRSHAGLRVAISLTRVEAGFQGRIVWKEGDGQQVGQRVLSSRSRECREIAANVAFAVALQLQLIDRGEPADTGGPVSNAERPLPEPNDEKLQGAPPAPPEGPKPPTDAAPLPAPLPPPRLRLAVGAGPVVALGMAPAVTGAGRLFLGVRFRSLSAEVAVDAAPPVTQQAADDSGVVVSTMGSTAAGCVHLSAVGACVLGRIGWIRARGTGVDVPLTSRARFYETGVRLAVGKDIGRFTLGIHADGLVMLARWNVVLNNTVFWPVPRVGGMLGFDVALRFF